MSYYWHDYDDTERSVIESDTSADLSAAPEMEFEILPDGSVMPFDPDAEPYIPPRSPSPPATPATAVMASQPDFDLIARFIKYGKT
jgi:hypothetical protein